MKGRRLKNDGSFWNSNTITFDKEACHTKMKGLNENVKTMTKCRVTEIGTKFGGVLNEHGYPKWYNRDVNQHSVLVLSSVVHRIQEP